MVPCLGRLSHKARLVHGTLLGKICILVEIWVWYLAWEDMYSRRGLGMVPCLGRLSHKARLGHGTLLWEDVYTSRDLCMVHCLVRCVLKTRLSMYTMQGLGMVL